MPRPCPFSWSVLAAGLAAASWAVADGDKPPRPQVSVVTAFPEQAPSGDTAKIAGSSIFKTYCASCHGGDARGDGPLADRLRVRPADLTRLSRQKDGTIDKGEVQRIIDGRNPVKGHGGTDMPVWGDVFKRVEEGYSEKKVAERIAALVAYLESLQQR